jgi:hypothetical protein
MANTHSCSPAKASLLPTRKPVQSDEETPIEGDPSEPKLANTTDAGQHNRDVINTDATDVAQRSPHKLACPFLPTIRPILHAEGSCQCHEGVG